MTAEQYRGLLEQDFSDIEIGDMKDLKVMPTAGIFL